MNHRPIKNTRWTTAFFHLVLFIGLGYLQAILSMAPFKDQPSSNLSFDFYTDVFWAVGITSILYLLLLLLIQRINQQRIQFILHGLFVALLWFWIDWGIFEDREAGWSTYTTIESLYATAGYSLWWVLGGCGLFLLGSWGIYKRSIKSS
ncbi:hypothetical protein [Myroides odoratus]|uniref:hypothetical protein n=1 Tax=Myroides odoratus TaxID=256 RepID=UPI0007660340|nr:hypothetical protein [Myroides odoratus]